MVNLDEVKAAKQQISDLIHRTPVLTSGLLNERTGNEIYLKAEHLQKNRLV
nr:hypothetical protein [Planococcus glaciei]